MTNAASTLGDLQRDFAQYLLRRADEAAMLPLIKPPARTAKEQMLGVYHNAYLERLREVLARDYPALGRLVGETEFAALAYAYACAHPSQSPNIRWFGASLASYIAVNGVWEEDPAAADLARFEWSIGLAFDAPEASPLGFADLAAVPPEDWAGLGFRLHPSLQFLSLAYDAPGWWLATQGPEPDPGADKPAPLPLPDRNWAIWRGDEGVQFRKLETDESEALWAVRKGDDFTALCRVLAGEGEADAAAMRAAGLLRAWVDAGWIVGLTKAR